MKRLETFVDWGQGGWDSFFDEKGSQWRDKDYRYLNDIFDLRTIDGSLLDVGCGLGDGLVYLQKNCPGVSTLTGTDFSDNAIESCKNNPQLQAFTFFSHDILQPIPRKYDTVICLQTLEHIEDPHAAIRHLIAATKCLLIIGVPYLNRRPDENHLWSFDESDFSDVMSRFCLGKNKKNIYWLLDKQNQGFRFLNNQPSLFRRLLSLIRT